MTFRSTMMIGLTALALAAAAGKAAAQQRGEECRVEEMDPRRGPARQTFCRGPDGQWSPRPDLDATSAGQTPSRSAVPAAAETAPGALPPDWRGTVIYNGTHQGYAIPAGRNARRQDYSGRYDLTLEIDGAVITARASGTGGLQPADLTGTRTGSQCRLYLADLAVLEATCTADRFVGVSREAPGQDFRQVMNIDARATRRVDAAEQEQQQAQAQAEADSFRTRGVPAAYVEFQPDAGSGRSLSSVLSRAVADDSRSWAANTFQAGSFRDFTYYRSPTEPTEVYARGVYSYTDWGGWPKVGWVAGRFVDGNLECLRFHDVAACTAPRQTYAAQVASLGEGHQKLGPMRVASSCFRVETRALPRTREEVVYADRNGDVETRTVHYTENVAVTVFACSSREYELQCVAEGVADAATEYIFGTGTTRTHRLVLTQGADSPVTSAQMTRYDERIAAGTCVRVR
jgi:surface antigen